MIQGDLGCFARRDTIIIDEVGIGIEHAYILQMFEDV